MLLLLCVFAAFARATRADEAVQSQPMPYLKCLSTVQQLTHGTRFARLLTTGDVHVIKIETGQKNLVITCDRTLEKMTVKVAG
jgi:hypothetical protein